MKEVYKFNSLQDYLDNSVKFNYSHLFFDSELIWGNKKNVIVKNERDFIKADKLNLYPIIGYFKKNIK